MLSLTIPGEEHFDNEKQEFLTLGDIVVEMEHSLVSLSKWESKFEKPFLSDDEKTNEELFSYIQTMCLTPNVPPEAWGRLGENELIAINEYINARMTATWFLETPQRGGSKSSPTR